MILKFVRCVVIFLFVSWHGAAVATDCPEHYAGGKPPEIINQKLATETQELCYEVFAVLHSGITRTPLYSAEHLVRDNIEAAQSLSRENSFHADENLPAGERAELKDYARSGFDRGHLSPNGDMPTRTAQHESFSLANIVPQNPNNNRYLWEGIEVAVRRLAKSEGELYVISGPAFIGGDIQKIGNVLVPTHLYKVVYSPKRNKAGAYFVANEATKEYATMPVSKLEQTIGIALLPGVSQRVKDSAMNLPEPTPHNEGGSGTRKTKRKAGDGYVHNSKLLETVEKLLKYLMKKG